jgi:hypothetical protein
VAVNDADLLRLARYAPSTSDAGGGQAIIVEETPVTAIVTPLMVAAPLYWLQPAEPFTLPASNRASA